jgi:hypothetical protein
MKWQRGAFHISIHGAELFPVEGICSGPFGIHKFYGKWNLTHVPTGHLIYTADTQKLLKRLASNLDGLTDWYAGLDAIRASVSKNQIHAIVWQLSQKSEW